MIKRRKPLGLMIWLLLSTGVPQQQQIFQYGYVECSFTLLKIILLLNVIWSEGSVFFLLIIYIAGIVLKGICFCISR